MNPTAEQIAIIEAAQAGTTLVVEAGAGSGKTSTLRMVAEALPNKRILYMAYNKTVQVDAAKSFPKHVECRTSHSLAFRQFGGPNKHRMGQFVRADQLAALLSIRPFNYQIEGEDFSLSSKQIAIVVGAAIGRFCMSADQEPTRYNVPSSGIHAEFRDDFIAHVLPYVKDAWSRVSDSKSTFPFLPGRGDGCYLKLWSLSQPTLPYDVIFYDEAQDANPATASVVTSQKSQIIYVGDSAQAIYGWNGAVDAMKNAKADQRLQLSKSFRFGQAIADQANRLLNLVGTDLRITGFEQIDSSVQTVSKPDTILCRTNAGVIESAMAAQAEGHTVAIVGGTKQIESFAKAAEALIDGRTTNHPELAAFSSWNHVLRSVDDGDGDDIAMLVRMVKDYGVQAILEVCAQSQQDEEGADIRVSTAHKAKGQEWNTVRIHHDFKAPKEGNELSVAEAMLIYVAVTRAKITLDADALHWLADFEAEINETMSEAS